MLDKITPGSRINVKVVKSPTNAAAVKTIVRLLSKDRGAMQTNARLKRARKLNNSEHQRGGRMWQVRIPAQRYLEGKTGESGTITATLDVLTDLKSVSRFVEVTPA